LSPRRESCNVWLKRLRHSRLIILPHKLKKGSFDLWHEGKRQDAFDMFGRISAFNSIPGSNEYVLMARGVFPGDRVMRKAAGARPSPFLDPQQKQCIRDAMDRFLKPYTSA
jgi:hypothetical protein